MSDWTALLNRAADSWASWMLHMSWQVALLVALVWVVCRILHSTAAQFRHLLWLVIFLKLVLPPTLATPWSAGTLYSRATDLQVSVTLVEQKLPETDSSALGTIQLPTIQPQSAPNLQSTVTTTSQPTPQSTRLVEKTVPLGAAAWIMLGWALVTTALLIAVAIQYLRFVRTLLKRAALCSAALQEIVAARAAELGICRQVTVMVSQAIHTPAVFGVRRPVIVLPEDCESAFSPEELSNIVAHEIGHIKRGDLLVTGLAGVLTCLYWFHPAVWIANLYQRREREMACDDLVLEKDRDAGKAYAATLLRVAERFTGRVPAFAGFLGLLELSDSLLHRVLSATDAKRPRRFGWASIAVLVAMVAFAPMAVWTASAQNDESATTPQENPAAKEIQQYYAKAHSEVQEYIRWTARTFGKSGLWLPETAFDDLTPGQREEKIKYYVDALSGEYGRHQCEALAAAGVLKDKRLLPGVLKAATYHRDDSDYDCRPKWIAVEAVGRIGDDSTVPSLIPLVDHGNQNTRMWARASLVRLTGQNFNDDKQAWGKWWNDSGKEPKIDLSQLKPWSPPGGAKAVSTASAATVAQTGWAPGQPKRRWGPEQAIGEPDTQLAGDIPTAWASLTEDGQPEWLQLEFGETVEAVSVKVYETYNPGALTRVTLVSQDGTESEVWKGSDPTRPQPDKSMGVSEIRLPPGVRTQCVKLYLDSTAVRGWNEIDAAGLVDMRGEIHWAVNAKASSTFAEQNASPPAPSASPIIGQAVVPPESQAVVDSLPGELAVKATYHHRSRGDDFPVPSTLWLKKSAGQIVAASYMPPMNATYVAYIGQTGTMQRYDIVTHGSAGRPPMAQRMTIARDSVTVAYEGGEKNGQTETFSAPAGNQFQPNTRPDPYIAHMLLAFQSLPMKDVDLACYDWDNTGKGMVGYNTKVEYKGKESVTAPAGTFEAQHYVETHTTFGDTWFKKRPGHVTEYWILDDGLMVRILRHREPYELLLATVEGPTDMQGRIDAAATAVPANTAPVAATEQTSNPAPPEVVSVTPAIGARDVDRATTEIRVTFDQDMAEGFSWTGGGEMYPKTTDKPSWIDKRTCVLPVALEAGRFYRVGINSKSHRNFRGASGTPTRPRAIYFATKGADDVTLAKLNAPKAVTLSPENGAANVPTTTATLTVTFNVPMGGGFSWTKAGGITPEMAGKPEWNAEMTACTVPVTLKPKTTYTLGLNSTWVVNFQSASGVPLDPVVWTFSTGD